MQRSFLTILALCSMALSAGAQGTMIIDSGANFGNGSSPYATTGGLVWLAPTGLVSNATLDTAKDINLAVLWGFSAGSVNTVLNLDPNNLNSSPSPYWLASQATGAGDMTSYGGGAILDPNGNAYVVPGAAAGSTIYLVLEGWTGNSPTPLDVQDPDFSGATAPFAITLAANTSPIQPDVRGMDALVLVNYIPEPSMLALASVGGAALMVVRRKK